MHPLVTSLAGLVVAQTVNGAALKSHQVAGQRETNISGSWSPVDLYSSDEARGPMPEVSIRLKIPIIGEVNPFQAIPSSIDELLPDCSLPNQSSVPVTGVRSADAFTQSSPKATDSPSPPAELSAPSRPEISTFYVTITNAPVTRTVLDVATFTQTITVPAPPSPPSPTVPVENVWNPPADFTDLDCFGNVKYGFGMSNLKVVHGIPASASVSASGSVPTGVLKWTNEMSAIEAFYPKGSINPGNSPQGGADFYANPLPVLKNAQNVTFGYSVFFPVDFEPVRGGKLPGLYGGKTGCSGGDAALDCFSTRLMWRAENNGELYLYAPKDKQTEQVCNAPPRSVCEADYGLSIARGSFKFMPGQWTHVSQTVVLNTPGQQDGYFTLDVNGKRVIDLQGVYYRQTATHGNEDEDEDVEVQSVSNFQGGSSAASANDGGASGQVTGTPNPNPNVESPPESREGGGLLGHILVSPPANSGSAPAAVWHAPGRFPVLLAPNPYTRHQRQRRRDVRPPVPLHDTAPQPRSPIRPGVDAYAFTVTKVLKPATITVVSRVTETRFATITAEPTPSIINLATKNKVPGFSGIFFSTFFGGHEQHFATPKDQKVWFKDFKLVVNE
ncbi:polysaccharide lyase family 14 protein [Ceratobasidium sp. AG-Ba]|nr:polysaccharide lyase family 14 protein [Ceratobasidium sp. AG-Ba]